MTEREKIIDMAGQFGIDPETAIRTKMRYFRQSIDEIKGDIKYWNNMIWEWDDPVVITLLNRRIERLDKKQRGFLIRIKNLEQDHQVSINGITSEQIEAARAFPIEDLLENIHRNRVRCPFHDDTNPSASIKNNKVHCFVCNKTWNPIDLVMQRDGLSFINAVRRLS